MSSHLGKPGLFTTIALRRCSHFIPNRRKKWVLVSNCNIRFSICSESLRMVSREHVALFRHSAKHRSIWHRWKQLSQIGTIVNHRLRIRHGERRTAGLAAFKTVGAAIQVHLSSSDEHYRRKDSLDSKVLAVEKAQFKRDFSYCTLTITAEALNSFGGPVRRTYEIVLHAKVANGFKYHSPCKWKLVRLSEDGGLEFHLNGVDIDYSKFR
jgi:hypothetical protein